LSYESKRIPKTGDMVAIASTRSVNLQSSAIFSKYIGGNA